MDSDPSAGSISVKGMVEKDPMRGGRASLKRDPSWIKPSRSMVKMPLRTLSRRGCTTAESAFIISPRRGEQKMLYVWVMRVMTCFKSSSLRIVLGT